MKSLSDISNRARRDLRERLYYRGVFDRQEMKEVAEHIARNYTAGVSAENLLMMAERDDFLSDGKGEKIAVITRKLHGFLRRELRTLVSRFWEGRTSVEMAVMCSRVELVGFFNKERPSPHSTANDPFEEMLHQQQQAPYA